MVLNPWLVLLGVLILCASLWSSRNGGRVANWIDRQNRKQDLVDFGGFILYFVVAGFLVISLGLTS